MNSVHRSHSGFSKDTCIPSIRSCPNFVETCTTSTGWTQHNCLQGTATFGPYGSSYSSCTFCETAYETTADGFPTTISSSDSFTITQTFSKKGNKRHSPVVDCPTQRSCGYTIPQTTSYHDIDHGCLPKGMGCTPRALDSERLMVHRGCQEAHKLVGIKSHFISNHGFHSSAETQGSGHSLGQYNSSELSQQAGRYSVSLPLQVSRAAMESVHRTQYRSHRYSRTRNRQYSGRCLEQDNYNHTRMDNSTTVPTTTFSPLGQTHSRCFCNSSQHPMRAILHERGPRPTILRGRTSSRLVHKVPLYVPTATANSKGIMVAPRPECTSNTNCPMVAATKLVPSFAANVEANSFSIPKGTRPTTTVATQYSPPRYPELGINSVVYTVDLRRSAVE